MDDRVRSSTLMLPARLPPHPSPTEGHWPHALVARDLQACLYQFVRRRVVPSDIDDVVQSVLCAALASPATPHDPGELRRWVLAIARNKVADLHRRRRPSLVADDETLATTHAQTGSPTDLVSWTQEQLRHLPEGTERTFRWMLREAEGETLEHIAAEHALTAACVRQRVSRLRRVLRSRWLAEMTAAAALVAALLVGTSRDPSPHERARALRKSAALACAHAEWQTCLAALDEARALDVAGDQAAEVRQLRSEAAAELTHELPAPDRVRVLPPPPER